MKRIVSTTAMISLMLTSVQPAALMAQEAACAPEDAACIAAQTQNVMPEVEAAPEAAPAEAPLAEAPAAEPPAQPVEEPAPAPEAVPQAAEQPAVESVEPEAQPAEAPNKNPSEIPVDTPPEAPAEAPPAETPAEAPVEAPAEIPAEAPVEQAAPNLEATPVPEAIEEPAPVEPQPQTEAAAPQEEPAVETAPEAVAEPAAEPAPASTPAPTPEELAEMEAVKKAAEEAAAQAAELAKAAEAAPPAAPVEVPEVKAEEAENLQALIEGTEEAPAAATAAADTPPAAVVETVITPQEARSSAQEFAPAPEVVAEGKKSKLSDLEKAGLVALGALAIGTMMSSGREVVSNSGDRVVVRDPDGGYQIYKDDDTLLRRPGSVLRSEQYADGSSRSVVERDDGVRVVTLRDASGRVLQRSQIDRDGREHVLIDDLRGYERVDVTRLPKPRPRGDMAFLANGQDAGLAAALAREDAKTYGRSFSLRQIRDIPELRRLAMTIDVDNITFASGSAVIRPSEAPKLSSLGRALQQMLAQNPAEVFLIEGHTDAVGSAASNLTLSDRRAESVALALTEYFGIPPENMVVQGYGESELRIPTEAAEPRNRRAALRLITPLMEARN